MDLPAGDGPYLSGFVVVHVVSRFLAAVFCQEMKQAIHKRISENGLFEGFEQKYPIEQNTLSPYLKVQFSALTYFSFFNEERHKLIADAL
jgi:hypothetical protein